MGPARERGLDHWSSLSLVWSVCLVCLVWVWKKGGFRAVRSCLVDDLTRGRVRIVQIPTDNHSPFSPPLYPVGLVILRCLVMSQNIF